MESPATPQATLNQFEPHLWEAANILHGPVDAADFKTYVFPLFVFKRISDVHTGCQPFNYWSFAKDTPLSFFAVRDAQRSLNGSLSAR